MVLHCKFLPDSIRFSNFLIVVWTCWNKEGYNKFKLFFHDFSGSQCCLCSLWKNILETNVFHCFNFKKGKEHVQNIRHFLAFYWTFQSPVVFLSCIKHYWSHLNEIFRSFQKMINLWHTQKLNIVDRFATRYQVFFPNKKNDENTTHWNFSKW